MTLSQLSYALSLKKYLSFKTAAQLLNISQPALSIQVKKLEEEIGIRLFNRATSPMELTRDGEQFLIRAQEVVNNARQLENFANELKDDFHGSLSIGIIPTLAPFLIPLFSSSLNENFPDLQLEFKEQITEQVVRNVRNGDLDCGLISTPISVFGIKSIPLFYEKFYVYTSHNQFPDSPDIRVEDIRLDELWLLDEGNCFRDQVGNFCDLTSMRKGRNFIYHSNSIDALIRIVDHRGGMTILPELTTMSLNGEQEENLKIIRGRQKAREIGMIVTTNHDKSRYIKLLEEYIRSNIPSHMLSPHDYEIMDPEIVMD